jgi:hypothetical protein
MTGSPPIVPGRLRCRIWLKGTVCMSTAAVWSWIAAVVSVAGLWLAGANPRAGWISGCVSQTVWAVYGGVTGQPGMIALSGVYIVLYGRALWNARGTQFPASTRARPQWRLRLRRPRVDKSRAGSADHPGPARSAARAVSGD